MAIEIAPIPLPEQLGTPEARAFEAYAELAEQLEVELLGTADVSYTAQELLVFARDRRYSAREAIGAWDGARLVGVADLQWEQDADATTAYSVAFGVVPERRREGIGVGLLEALEARAREVGRPGLVLMAAHAFDDGSGDRVRPPQGDASLPASLPAVRFARAHGYELGQLDRMSVLEVTGRDDEFRGRLDAAAADDGYRIVVWRDHAPDELVDSLARAHQRMSVDAPAGAISYEEELWDAARVRADEAQSLEAGRLTLTAAAVSAAGEVAGYTQLTLPPGKTAVYQDDTLVLGPHRGHGLGLRLKLANLVALADTAPERERVYTWNADENAHMLAINLALGFTPVAIESAWQRPAS
ncbi:GNAT family N-acetyltransferase [Agromyces aerolatus]|uniref:GNAT family N-acetyltransferase n=1 Tax=Agromyces sp. LY-1074 TaxID=3074080 RepID=UPI002855E28B|nr:MULTISPECIES: GNAT family N-acetyltransferase [unclassified Agromyces]MDR5699979.1 GNAT family N-acetyltransferase [Agromyces sp. LY-1074]MDR5706209.1 GNAT family N-acetyltransferase [Agromyces sp. LY-1358]